MLLTKPLRSFYTQELFGDLSLLKKHLEAEWVRRGLAAKNAACATSTAMTPRRESKLPHLTSPTPQSSHLDGNSGEASAPTRPQEIGMSG